MSDWGGIAWLVVLLLVNAFFVGAEFAVISARRSQIEPRAEAGQPGREDRALGDGARHADARDEPARHHGLLAADPERLRARDPSPARGARCALTGWPEEVDRHGRVRHHAAARVVPARGVRRDGAEEPLVLGARPRGAAAGAAARVRRARLPPDHRGAQRDRERASCGCSGSSRRTRRPAPSRSTRSRRSSTSRTREGVLDRRDRHARGGVRVHREEGRATSPCRMDELVTLPEDATPADVERAVAQRGFSRYVLVDDEGEPTGYLHLKDVHRPRRATSSTSPVPPKRIRQLISIFRGHRPRGRPGHDAPLGRARRAGRSTRAGAHHGCALPRGHHRGARRRGAGRDPASLTEACAPTRRRPARDRVRPSSCGVALRRAAWRARTAAASSRARRRARGGAQREVRVAQQLAADHDGVGLPARRRSSSACSASVMSPTALDSTRRRLADVLGERHLVARGRRDARRRRRCRRSRCRRGRRRPRAPRRRRSRSASSSQPPSAQSVAEKRTSSGTSVADLGAHRRARLEQEPRPVLERAAVRVVALVDERREELVQQVAVRGVQLDQLEAGVDRAAGGRGEVVDDAARCSSASSATRGARSPRRRSRDGATVGQPPSLGRHRAVRRPPHGRERRGLAARRARAGCRARRPASG